jgi:hypothetical protein
MGDYSPVACDGRYGYICSANVTGGQLVENTGNGIVGPAGLTSAKVVGVAAFDQVTNGKVTVHPIDDLHETIAGTGGLTAGQPVKAGAAGTVVLFVAGTDAQPAFLGICTVGATAGNLARWQGY